MTQQRQPRLHVLSGREGVNGGRNRSLLLPAGGNSDMAAVVGEPTGWVCVCVRAACMYTCMCVWDVRHELVFYC